MKTTTLINQLEQLQCRVQILKNYMNFYIDTKRLSNWQFNRVYYDQTEFKPAHLPVRLDHLKSTERIKTIDQICQEYINTPVNERGAIPEHVNGELYYLNDRDLANLTQLSHAIGDNPPTPELKAVQNVIQKLHYQREFKTTPESERN